MAKLAFIAACAALLFLSFKARAQGASDARKAPYEPELARSLGADDNGMKRYVLVVLKTGPNKVPARPERDEMFKGHFANMNRLAAAGKLALGAVRRRRWLARPVHLRGHRHRRGAGPRRD